MISTSGMTQAGQLYARLARDCARWTTLTRSEADTLINLPLVEAELMTHPPLGNNGEKEAWNMEKLEMRGFIERLIDGQSVCAGAGQRIQQAVSREQIVSGTKP